VDYVIVGAGSLGQSFAALLARSGQRVILLATPRSASRLRANGAIRLHGAMDAEVPVGAKGVAITSDAADVPDGAALVFATKGYDLAGAIDAVQAAGGEVAWTAGVQNGIVKDDLLAAAFGAERVVAAVTIFGAGRQADGSVNVMSPGATYFGALDGPISARVQQAADTFQAAGIPTQARKDIASVLWSKACNATGVFGVTVLARTSNNQLFSNPHLMRAYLVLVRETAAVAAAYGVQVGDFPSFPPIRTFVDRDTEETIRQLNVTPSPRATGPSPTRDRDDTAGRGPTPSPGPVSYASMTQDLLAGAPLEVDAIFGDIVQRADARAVPVPGLRLVRDLIRGLDQTPR
jgi:2-dehydropantoate 2-reductase